MFVFHYVTKFLFFLLCHQMFVFIMSPNGFGAALYSTVSRLTLLFRAAAARIKSQSPIIFPRIKRNISSGKKEAYFCNFKMSKECQQAGSFMWFAIFQSKMCQKFQFLERCHWTEMQKASDTVRLYNANVCTKAKIATKKNICRLYNWCYNGQSKAKRSIRRQRQWLDSLPHKSSPRHLFVLPGIFAGGGFPVFEWQNFHF